MPDDPKPVSIPHADGDLRTSSSAETGPWIPKDDPSTAPESGDRKATG
jgi:hypothetical protein